MTKAQKIRNFANDNASATPQEIADACGVTRIYVYQVLHKMKNKKIKAIKSMKPVVTEGQDVLRKEIKRLHEDLDGWRELYLSSAEALTQYEQDVVGYRAVISYLQGKLDGATV